MIFASLVLLPAAITYYGVLGFTVTTQNLYIVLHCFLAVFGMNGLNVPAAEYLYVGNRDSESVWRRFQPRKVFVCMLMISASSVVTTATWGAFSKNNRYGLAQGEVDNDTLNIVQLMMLIGTGLTPLVYYLMVLFDIEDHTNEPNIRGPMSNAAKVVRTVTKNTLIPAQTATAGLRKNTLNFV